MSTALTRRSIEKPTESGQSGTFSDHSCAPWNGVEVVIDMTLC